ncbi:unnamed protein product [Dicrocoelium dendriticum]|nr:unnamed protein product [Dicrocoelium dendriticum]
MVAMNNQVFLHSKAINDGEKLSLIIEGLEARTRCRAEMDGAWLVINDDRIHMPGDLRRNVGSPHQLQFYSYPLNPVEHVLTKMKTSVRRLPSRRCVVIPQSMIRSPRKRR